MANCALALGFEKMQKGSLAVDDDDVNPLGVYIYVTYIHVYVRTASQESFYQSTFTTAKLNYQTFLRV